MVHQEEKEEKGYKMILGIICTILVGIFLIDLLGELLYISFRKKKKNDF